MMHHSISNLAPNAIPFSAQRLLPSDLSVVHVVRQYAPAIGGLEEFVARLAGLQQKGGIKVRVVTCNRNFRDLETPLPEHEVVNGIEVTRLPFSGSTRYPVLKGLHGAIADADLVHVHAVDYAFDALALTRPFHGKPIVATTHGGFFHTNRFAALKKVWFRTLTRLSTRFYDRVICCSESDKALFDQIAPGRTQLILNGVDTQKFAGCSAARPTRRMVTLGRFSSNKRLDLLIGAVAALVARDPAWHLDIVGVPSDLSAADLEGMIADKGLAKHVTLHVGLPETDVAAVMAQATYFVSASHYEGFGLALIEAMSAGLLPVVHRNDAFTALAGDVPGITLCDFGSPAAVADALTALAAPVAGDLADRRRNAASSVERFSWKYVKREYDAVYADVLGQRPA
ncbi:glycosyltransferase family 4 protein [Zhengella mangrovi]|nr:glycosyltransferase family 4 protein [Zhengella mangrovi]